MATNRDLLKEAIADAKAVKETAIANAKAALEEAFTPFLKEKLSAKLNEMEEEMTYDEADTMEEMDMKDEEMANEEISLDELLAELDSEEEGIYEAEESEEEEEEGEEEEMSIEDMSEDDLKHFIEDVIKDMVSAGELEAGHEGEGEEEEADEDEIGGEEERDSELELDEEFDINELLAELEETSYSKKATSKGSLVSTKGKDEYATPESQVNNPAYSKSSAEKVSFMDEGEVSEVYLSGENINGPELFASLLGVTTIIATAAWSTPETRKAILAALSKGNIDGAKRIAQNASEKKSEMEEQLAELKAELNEVNVLNAKLLYTNKIFRNKSLTESQKVKVLTAFDKATTRQEAQLVYETLLESLKATVAKAPIKESMGSASKVLGGVTSKPIIENDAFARMRELAFGKNK